MVWLKDNKIAYACLHVTFWCEIRNPLKWLKSTFLCPKILDAKSNHVIAHFVFFFGHFLWKDWIGHDFYLSFEDFEIHDSEARCRDLHLLW